MIFAFGCSVGAALTYQRQTQQAPKVPYLPNTQRDLGELMEEAQAEMEDQEPEESQNRSIGLGQW